MATEDAITIFRGEDIVVELIMDPVEDITGWTIEFTVEGSPLTPKLIGPKVATVTDGPNGVSEVALTAAETDLTPGHYKYDSFRVDAGSSQALAVGTFTVRDVARLPAA